MAVTEGEITKIEALKTAHFPNSDAVEEEEGTTKSTASLYQYHQLQQHIQQHQQRLSTTTLATQSGQNEVNTQTSTNKASV